MPIWTLQDTVNITITQTDKSNPDSRSILVR